MDQGKGQFLDSIMNMSLAEFVHMLSTQGGGKVEVEVEPEEEDDEPLTRKKGRNGRLGPAKQGRIGSRMMKGEDDEEGSMSMCCGFDDQDHIGSSYS